MWKILLWLIGIIIWGIVVGLGWLIILYWAGVLDDLLPQLPA